MKFNKIFQALHTPIDKETGQVAKAPNRRLSKPKTKSASTSNLAIGETIYEPSSESTASRTSTFSDTEAVIAALPGQHQARSDARQKLRAQLFNLSTSSDTECAVDDGDDASPDGEVEHNAKGGLKKSNSFSSRLSSARASSTNLLTTLTGSRLSLVPESRPVDEEQKALAPEELEEIEDKIRQDRRLSAHRLSMPSSKTSDEAGPAPIRRKSFLTPGIATRGGSHHPLRKPPPPKTLDTDQDRDYYYNPNVPESSPLSQIAAMDLGTGSTSSLPRPLTPNENLEYSFLAGLKRGTLRITNGTASPVPSFDTKSLEHDDKNDEAFFSASEGLRSEDEGARGTLVRRQSSVYTHYGHEQRRDDDSQMISRASISIKTTKTRYRPQSPLRFDGQISNRAGSRVTSETGTVVRRKSLSSSEANSTPDKTLSMAREYRDELASSPFIFDESPVPSPKLQATSKVTEFDADLFEDDDEGSLFGSEPGSVRGGTREAALRILDGKDSPPPTNQPFKLSPGLLDPDLLDDPSESIGKPLAKADSGYSSTTSIRSFYRDRNGQVLRGVAQDVVDDLPVQQKPGNTDKALPPPPMRPAPALPAPTLPSRSPNRNFTQSPRKALPNVSDRALSGFFEKGLEGVRDKELPKPPMRDPTVSTESNTNNLVEPPCPECIRIQEEEQRQRGRPIETKKKPGSVANARKKLQKQRPRSQPPLLPPKFITVQRYREIGQQHIPPVPSEIAARHANRPKILCGLEHTLQSLQHIKNPKGNTPSPEPSPPSWKFPILSGKQNPNRRHSDFAETRGKSRFSRPAPTREYVSAQEQTHDHESSWQRESASASNITDFGTVAQSLGSSPYDAALAAASWQPRRESGQRSLSPYQMGAMPRPRSVVGMTEEEASEYGRERSMMRKASAARNFSRPRSMHEATSRNRSSMEFDGPALRGRLPRPQSLVLEAPPPVPALPRVYSSTNIEESEVERNTRMNRAVHFLPQPTEITGGRFVDAETLYGNKESTEKFSQQLSQSWAEHRAAWKERRRSAGEALVGVKADQVNQASQASQANPAVPDRYDGGFEYGYEAGNGCGGSAGTRNMTMNASRKSVGVSQNYGIDFSDVPVFVRG